MNFTLSVFRWSSRRRSNRRWMPSGLKASETLKPVPGMQDSTSRRTGRNTISPPKAARNFWIWRSSCDAMCAAHSVTKKRDSPGVSMVQRRFHLSGLSSWPHGGWRISAKSPVWWRSTLTKDFSPPSILWMAGRASGSKMCPPPPTLRTRAAM